MKINTQHIRIADIFIVGPLMIYSGYKSTMPDYLRYTMMIFGAATIIYNGFRYLQQQNQAEPLP